MWTAEASQSDVQGIVGQPEDRTQTKRRRKLRKPLSEKGFSSCSLGNVWYARHAMTDRTDTMKACPVKNMPFLSGLEVESEHSERQENGPKLTWRSI